MIFQEKMKNLKIYKTPMFLPTLENDKKRKSAILLMTPNYESSKKLLDNPLFVNRLRYSSYYIEKDVSYYINGKLKEVDNNADVQTENVSELYYYQNLLEMTTLEKSKLKDSDFGLPEKRKYPLDNPDRVRSAVKFFNYCSKEDEKELADNIIKAIKKFNLNIKIGERNRLSKYYSNPVTESDNTIIVKNALELGDDIKVKPSHFTFTASSFYNAKIMSKICTLENYINILLYIGVDITKEELIPYVELIDSNEDTYSINENKIIIHVPSFSTEFDDFKSFEDNFIMYEKVILGTVIECLISYFYPNTHSTAITMIFSHRFMKFDDNYSKLFDLILNSCKTDEEFRKLVFIDVDLNRILSIAKDNNLPFELEDLGYHYISKEAVLSTKTFAHDSSYISESLLVDESEDEVSDINLDDLKSCNENNYISTGDKLIFFYESNQEDTKLRSILFNDRIKKRQEIILLYDQVKKDFSFIKYTFVDIAKYQQKNLFVDLYFYNNIFFQNNDWVMKKGFNLFIEYMNRLINNPNIDKAGYQKKTIFIPINAWDKNKDSSIWNYRKSINPLSVIYSLMFNGSNQLNKLFGNNDIIFIGNNCYFKINFSQIESKDLKVLATKFKTFLIKICKNEDFELSDIDTTADNSQSQDVIQANIIDKIEIAKGVDITSRVVKASKSLEKQHGRAIPYANDTSKADKKPEEKSQENTSNNISKGTLNKVNSDADKKEKDLDTLAASVANSVSISNSEDDAMDFMDNETIRKILIDLDSYNDDKVNITASRTARMNELEQDFLNKEIKGKSVKDILNNSANVVDETPISLEIDSPNEEWKSMDYIKFDKNYNLDADIIKCFQHFNTVSRPISIRNMEVVDNSTSEDRVELYTVDMEDYRGKRFKIKLDIPVMIDNRFLLRGNNKSIQTQLFNMPIIKTDFDTCQIVTNYMKIFIRRFGSTTGKSLPLVGKFIKAANKYSGNKIKFDYGDNSKVCSKYELPIDYIDLSSVFNKIETDEFIIYFNQDEIRSLYPIDNTKGIPFLYKKKEKEIVYIETDFVGKFVDKLLGYIGCKEFYELIDSVSSPTICSYSRCSIMNSEIPLVLICAYHEGLRKVLDKAKINYKISLTLSKEDRHDNQKDWLKFKDGYLIYDCTYASSLLLNGLKACPIDEFEISNIDNRNMYLEFLDGFGGRIKADGLDNFYDLEIDPITKEVLEFYKFPTDYVSILLYGNALLADNKFIKHTDASSKRIRRYELIAVYTYKVLADAYASYANQLKHNRDAAEFSVKQSAVIDKFLSDSISSDDSCINALRDVETTNAVTTKGPSGMNSDRAYSLDKRTYDESMLNVLGMSTGFAANVGITRQTTIDANAEGTRGYVKGIHGNTDKMNTTKSLTATEALTPFGSTRDDPIRTAMTFIQTAKHAVRTEDSDPLLVTNGTDEAMPYLTSDKFAFKAKKDGKVVELTDNYILISYNDGTSDYINLSETIEKNSDGGYYVPLKLDKAKGIKVGSKVKENQVLAYDKYSFSNSVGESNNIAYNIGKLAKVAIVNTDEGFEDSGIITENMAEKLATRIDLKFDVVIDKESTIYNIAKVGQHVECRDNLLVWQTPFDDADTNILLKSLTKDDVSELGKRKLESEVTGTVTAIKIYRTVELDDLSDSLRKIVEEYEKPYIEFEKKLKENNLDISQIPAHYVLPPTGKLKKAQDAVLIEFFVEYKDIVGIGDKVVYFSANKAVEKNIIPKGKEPYTDFRPNEEISAFVSETSIDKRMVTSTIIYGSLQKLMVELDRSVKDILGIPYDDSTV